jgi:hypothetical protein
LPQSTPRHDLPNQAPFGVKLGATVATFLVVLGVVASVAVFLVRSQVERAIEHLEERTGRHISVGSLDISLVEGLAVRNVTVTKPHSEELHVHLDLLQTDLDFFDLLTGRKKPKEVTIRGLHTKLQVNRHGVKGFDDLIRRKKKKDKPKAKGQPLRVSITDSTLILDLRLPGLSAREIVLNDFVAKVRVGGAKEMELKGKADVRVDAQKRSLVFEIDTGKGGLLRAELDEAIAIPLTTKGRRYLLHLQGLTRSKTTGATTLMGLRVQNKDLSVTLDSLRVKDAGGRYIPQFSSVSQATIKKLRAASKDRSIDINSIGIEFRKGKSFQPERVIADGVVGKIKSRRIRAELAKIDVALKGSIVNAAVNQRPLDAIASVSVERPFMRIPTADKLVANVPGIDLLDSQGASPPQDGDEAASSLRSAASTNLKLQLFQKLRSMPLSVTEGKLVAVDSEGAPIMELSDVDINVRHSGKAGLQIGVDARLVRKATPTGKFSVRGTFSDEGDLEVVTGIVKGKDIAHFLSGFSEYLSVDRDSEVEMEFAYTPPSEARPLHRLRVMKAMAKNLGFQAWRVSHSPVTGIGLETTFVAEYDAIKRHLQVQVPRLTLGKAQLQGTLDLTRPIKEKPRLAATVKMPMQNCANVAASIPEVMIPRLKGMKVSGQLSVNASLTVDLEKPKTLKLKVDGNIEKCKIDSLGNEIRIADLKKQLYEHHPIEPERGRLNHITVGPGTPEWVPSRMLPAFVKAAAVVTEDRSFYAHKGVRWDLIGRALRMDVRKGRFVYGGSTITQQLVKNLYLTREKTLARKLEELIISGQMERELTKDEILTLYVNMVEFGPDIYGVKRAARFYFAKEAWHLSPLEAAFIMGLKPYPKAGFAQWERQSLNSWWIKRVVHVMDMVRRREGAISKLEFKGASPYQPRFRRPEESTFSGRRYARPTALPSSLAPSPGP